MKTFKHTFFIAIVVSCLILISRFTFDTTSIVIILCGCLVAIFFPYLDLILNAFFITPQLENSLIIKSLFLRREYLKLITFIDSGNFSEYKSTINSAHFQVVLVLLGFYFLSTSPLLFGFSFLLSLMYNLIYRLYISLPFYHKWFWLFKNPVSLNLVKMWIIVDVIIAIIYTILI